MIISLLGLVVRCQAGKWGLVLIPLQLSSLFKRCSLWLLFCAFVPHNINVKMAFITATLMQESFWWWQSTIRYSLPLPPPPGILVHASTSLLTSQRSTSLNKSRPSTYTIIKLLDKNKFKPFVGVYVCARVYIICWHLLQACVLIHLHVCVSNNTHPTMFTYESQLQEKKQNKKTHLS